MICCTYSRPLREKSRASTLNPIPTAQSSGRASLLIASRPPFSGSGFLADFGLAADEIEGNDHRGLDRGFPQANGNCPLMTRGPVSRPPLPECQPPGQDADQEVVTDQ